MREGSGVQGSAIGMSMFHTFSLKYYPVSYWEVPDKSSDFLLPILVDKDEGVVFGVLSVVLVPPFSRVH